MSRKGLVCGLLVLATVAVYRQVQRDDIFKDAQDYRRFTTPGYSSPTSRSLVFGAATLVSSG